MKRGFRGRRFLEVLIFIILLKLIQMSKGRENVLLSLVMVWIIKKRVDMVCSQVYPRKYLTPDFVEPILNSNS